MVRTLVTLLMATVVLTCPYICLGGAVIEAIAPSYGCETGCCDDPYQRSDEAPDTPARRDSDCLCQGAIATIVHSGELDMELSPEIDWAFGAALAREIQASIVESPFEPPHHFPPFSTGRDVCTLTGSLLL